ncbi:Pkinase-domain-containing protein [Calocera cornea HHB12733]|uniref:Pkinase-domain-containing protein n=1 Tax=Calocera cornea HHB12733 TaxID=1353952 RepID=A0A165DJU2_9BASI|nr:Pkinase-domain-containing protein [Calocera cornea HHB12733]
MPHRNRSHAPTLYPHPEASDGEDEYAASGGAEPTPRRPRPNTYTSSSSVPSVASSSSMRSQRTRIRPTVSYGGTTVVGSGSDTGSAVPGPAGKDQVVPLSKYQSAFASFASRYRGQPAGYDEYGDTAGVSWGVISLDVESDDEEARSGLRGSTGVPVFDRFAAELGDGSPVVPQTDEERERLEWQTMLASVLEGDVLRMEKTRIASSSDEGRDEAQKRTLHIWLGIRARLRGRTEEQERKRLEERRARTVQPAIDEILQFRVSTAPGAPSALDQALAALDKLDVAESLYPDLKSLRAEYPASERPEFVERTAALTAYVRMAATLRARIQGIQKWTGSETMDVWQRHTSQEQPVRRAGPAGHTLGGQELADESSFVERVLKEDSLQKTLERATLVTSHWVVDNARETIFTYAPLYRAMGLPGVENELVALIAFPTKLMEATLRVRLDYGKKVNEPSVLVVDQMLDDFSLSIALACTIKQEYDEFMREDEQGFWALPSCISHDYDEVLLEALRFLFKLIHWKLKTASRIYFKEVDVLEAQWPLFTAVSLVTEGGSLLVAEHVCSVTNKLMARVVNLFETQLRLPVYKPSLDSRSRQSPRHTLSRPRLERANAQPVLKERDRPMNEDQILDWYNTVLDSVRLRYRKLQRFGRVLTQRFTNAAEYTIAHLPVDRFINALVQTDHLLVYCENYEEDGIYIIADTSLRNRPYMIHDILQQTFQPGEHVVGRQAGQTDTSGGEEDEEDESSAPYVLLITPGERFVWTGDVMVFDTPKLEFELAEKRVRLIADGPQLRLARSKERFGEIMRSVRPEGTLSPTSDGGEPPSGITEGDSVFGSGGGSDYCIIPQQAHHPRVDRQLRRITRSTNRLAEAITKSVHRVSDALEGVEHRQELLANWYAFAAENGQQAQKHMDHGTWQKFNRELMKLAIAYVSFICDECDPTDRRTFRWAVNALEFATLRTRGSNILNLPEADFNLLRSKVATCMTLLISHFDILGARSNLEASQREQERLSQIKQRQEEAEAKRDDDDMLAQPDAHYDPLTVSNWAKDRSIRLNRDESWLRALRDLEVQRGRIESEQRIAGKVINEERPEDKSLVFLASSSSNIAMRWQQGRLVGTGAFGTVYLGVNLDSGSLMAVKEIRFSDVNSLTTLYKNVKDELSVMEMLSHPNIVEYYGIEVHRDKVYIFEEYCQGGSLGSLLEHGRIEDERIIQVYTLQMLEGLNYLHSKGVIHRDIKPDNILLDHMGVIKYVDFGAAKILGKKQKTVASRAHQHHVNHHPHLPGSHGHAPPAVPPGLPSGFGANSLTGTPMYMSPEVIKNDRRGRQGAMDIWSLGCVVLEMSTGRKPWSNLDNEWAIMFHIGVAAKPPPLPDTSQLSESGIDFVRRCLTIDPLHRPTTTELMEHPWIADFRDEMLEYDEDEGTSLTTPSMTTTHTTASEHFEMATFAHQAQRIEDLETAAMKSESPPDITPGEGDDGILGA